MDLLANIAQFGALPQNLVQLGQNSPAVLPYATLEQEAMRRDRPASIDAVVGIYEWQGDALAYLVEESRVRPGELPQLRRRLALRGEAPWLGLVAPGRLTLHSVDLDRKSERQSRVEGEKRAEDPDALHTFPRLALGFFSGPKAHPGGQVRKTLRKLLREGTRTLVEDGHVLADAQSLVGRALFVRFLGDRHLLEARSIEVGLETHQLFRDRRTALATSQWLDRTFNGDLLKPSDGAFAEERSSTWSALGDILHRAPGGQLALGWQDAWDDFDFAHIPLGVLSEAFEDFMADHDPLQQDSQSAHYTPALIAERMVAEVFAALGDNAYQARVLDPSVGGGIFLLAAFRRLVEECWRREGRRPDTARLREILYGQLAGFDINEGAIRYAALGLYLLTIELDPAPLPIEKLRFPNNLVGRVLFPVGWGTAQQSLDPEAPISVPGSLGEGVGSQHSGQYDIVIGNPPWSDRTWTPKAWAQVNSSVESVAKRRGIDGVKLPRYKPDIPFLWRAMDWARPGGLIALAMHGRLLFQSEAFEARNQIFKSLDVTGVVNGAELRMTQIWKVAAPFLLLFAINRKPGSQSGFWFVTPRWEPELNSIGRMRVDASNAESVHCDQLNDVPTLPKVLFRGSAIDLSILKRFKGVEPLHRRWVGSNGYMKLRPSSPLKAGESEPGSPVGDMLGIPELHSEVLWQPLVITEETFSSSRLHRPRDINIYRGPKLIVRKSVPAKEGRVKVSISLDDLVFSETFYGYRLRTGATPRVELKALFLLLSSQVALWYLLMTSGEFGFEREVFEKSMFDELPVVGLTDLPAALRAQVDVLFDAVIVEPESVSVWGNIDAWAAEAYGLRPEDVKSITDTLAYHLPFASHRKLAVQRPNRLVRRAFAHDLTARLEPLLRRFELQLVVDEVDVPERSPWEALFLRTVPIGAHDLPTRRAFHPGLLAAADEQAATEVLVPDGEGLWMARLARARHWSHNQAILCARNLAFHHLSALVRRR